MEFTLRPFIEADAFSIARYANNIKIWRNLRDLFPHPYTIADAFGFIAACSTEKGQFIRAIDIGGEAAGSIGLAYGKDVHSKTAELGYWLAEPYWGRGVMTGAVTEICGLAFGELGLMRVFAEPYSDNIASRRVLEKAGFVLEGVMRKAAVKQGVIKDCCMYARIV
ncbi:MAG: GNAT family N-acetyltransferase [Oscillospiraceae bacterium]|jgi:ribosomal-protein-alanine N-acetyltransferase